MDQFSYDQLNPCGTQTDVLVFGWKIFNSKQIKVFTWYCVALNHENKDEKVPIILCQHI
jgi:hypothetical protein